MNWTEKYRPETIADMAGVSDLKRDAKGWEEKGYPPALLFSGGPGTGKTTAAIAIAKMMHGEHLSGNLIVTNASDDRGIGFIRDELKQVARTRSITGGRKVILLDEADGLTPAAQDALRQIIENTNKSTLFILTANHPEKLKPAIKSRCRHYKFGPVTPEDGVLFLHEILKEEAPMEWMKVCDKKEKLEQLVAVCNGDLRKAISILESLPEYTEASIEGAVRSESSELSDASMALMAGDLSLVSVRLNGALERGDDRFSILHGLRRRIRDLLEDEDYFNFMLTWGEFMSMANEWPADDRSFFEYFVAKLAQKSNSFKNQQK